jgi:hypothetical protein
VKVVQLAENTIARMMERDDLPNAIRRKVPFRSMSFVSISTGHGFGGTES